MCYHSLNIRIRSFTPCCATVLGKWANTPWWDLPSPWRGHGPSPKVTFGVMMPNAGVPAAWLHHHNTTVEAEESECEIEVTKLYCMDCASCWEDSWYILVSWAQIPAWSCTHAVSLQHHHRSIDMHFPSQLFCPAFRWWPGAPLHPQSCRKLTVAELMALKGKRQIVLTTAFDEWTARAAEEAVGWWSPSFANAWAG